MALLIDGHNLIGAGVFLDISLSDEHDEVLLVQRLRAWRSRYRGEMTVVFDRGIVGGRSRDLSGGGLTVIFMRNPREADDFIRQRVRQAGAAPRAKGARPPLIVVTNDRALRQEAVAHNVALWRGEEFVAQMQPPDAPAAPEHEGVDSDVRLSGDEIDEWLDLFGGEPKTPARPAAPKLTKRKDPFWRSSVRKKQVKPKRKRR